MKPRLYIETTIPSLLTARPSKDPVLLGHQISTQQWWQTRLSAFEAFTSIAVLDEAGRGEPAMAAARLSALGPFPLLVKTDAVDGFEAAILSLGVIPPSAAIDALHLALATVHRIDFLLTWNCRHINNANLEVGYRRLAEQFGYSLPVIATPEELMYSMP
jgi:hypothetical protein